MILFARELQICWGQAALHSQIEVKKGGETKYVSSKNDELIVYKDVHPKDNYALVGIELKKMLNFVDVTQAVAELMIYGRESKFPIVQVGATVSSLLLRTSMLIITDFFTLQILTDLDLSVAFYISDVKAHITVINYRLFSWHSR
jgi:hypothetical protein